MEATVDQPRPGPGQPGDRSLTDPALPLLAFELEGARLSDASCQDRGWTLTCAIGDGPSSGPELRDLWLGGRGLPLVFAFSLLISVITYLGATKKESTSSSSARP